MNIKDLLQNLSLQAPHTETIIHKPKGIVRSVNEETTPTILQSTPKDIYAKSIELRNGTAHIRALPEWQIYANMYGNIPAVSAAVNKKANTIRSAGWYIRDANGYAVEELTSFCKNNKQLDRLITRLSKSYDVYGGALIGAFKKQPEDTRCSFSTIPLSETRDFVLEEGAFKVLQFYWNNYNLGYHKVVTNIDTESFFLGVDDDLDDQVFGAPRLRALYTDLDTKLRDDKNYQMFLQNASMPGIVALVSSAAEQSTVDEVSAVLRSWRDDDTKHKGGVVANATDNEGNPMIQFTTIAQDLQNRLSLEEKKEIAGLVYDCLFIPRKIMGLAGSGMGANEYESAMHDYKVSCIEPQMRLISNNVNQFVLPIILKEIGEEKLSRYKIKSGDLVRGAKVADFEFCFEEISVELPSERRRSFMDGYDRGIFLASEVKLLGYGMDEDDIQDDDEFRKMPSGVAIIKKGNLQEGIIGGQEEGEESEGIPGMAEMLQPKQQESPNPKQEQETPTQPEQEEIADVDTDATELNEVQKAIFHKAKIRAKKSGKLKKHRDDLFRKLDPKYSKVPAICKTPKADQFKQMLERSFYNQYKNSIESELGIVKKDITPIEEQMDMEEVILTLLFVASLAVRDIEEQYGRPLSDTQKQDIYYRVDQYIKGRINALTGHRTDELALLDIRTPYYTGNGLDATTEHDIQRIVEIVQSEQDFDYLSEIENIAKRRSELVGDDTLATIFGATAMIVAEELGALTKTWLRTISENPRLNHLAMVGETVGFYQKFSNGSFWSNEEINCKCGIAVGFKDIRDRLPQEGTAMPQDNPLESVM